jgi:serine/threonine protein kinase
MSLCINPRCSAPQNPDNTLFCEACGSELLLQGRYRAFNVLGGGGFGKTYEVKEGTTAVKVLKVLINNSPKAVELFQREAQVLSQLDDPGIPKVEKNSYFVFYPRDEPQPLHCMVMEKIDGDNLWNYIKKRRRPIDGDLARIWLIELGEILNKVHSHDIIHRDLKPNNIILQPDGKLVLIDFGAVTDERIIGESTEIATSIRTEESTRVYSKNYTAPEQIQGQAIKQSDIYSLGITFVYLLTAKEPNDPIMYDVHYDRVNWQQYSQEVSPQLADLINQMIQRVPNLRPANTQVILQQLQQMGRVAKKGEDIEVNLEISHIEAAAGTQKEVEIPHIININGISQPEAKSLKVMIPAGTRDGGTILLNEQGNEGENGGENGDVYVRISVNEIVPVINPQELAELDKNPGCLGFLSSIFGGKKRKKQRNPSLVRKILTAPIEGNPTLKITVFGARGVGKTSILAAMYDQFNKTTKNTDIQLTANIGTSAILQERVAELQSPFSASENMEVTGGIQGTSEPQDFIFSLSRVGGPTIMKLCFKDFPGGRIGSNALESEMLEVKKLLETCQVVLIIIDSPALIEDNGVWHELINKPGLIRDYFKLSYQNLTEPTLILFVPSKCEKYMRNNPEYLLQKVTDGYSELLHFFANKTHRQNIIIGVTPVQTLGNIIFDRIETNMISGRKQPHFYYKKIGHHYEPNDSEQPLRYILKFLLKLHLKKQILLSKSIRSLLGFLFEDVAFKEAVSEFGKLSKTDGGFAIIQDDDGWLC